LKADSRSEEQQKTNSPSEGENRGEIESIRLRMTTTPDDPEFIQLCIPNL
jgi:hypothetical protein